MLEIKGLKKKFNDNQVLDGIDLTIKKGDVIGVIGPSGTGKSTLLRCINFLEIAEEGYMKYTDDLDSNNVIEINFPLKGENKKNSKEFVKKTGMVFQNFNLFEHKNTLKNVMSGLTIVQKKNKKEAKEIALKELNNVGLLDHQNHYPRHLSGGQKQRVAIARTLAMKPEILLLDEPTSALDPELIGEVLTTIKDVASEGYTMILVSHEMDFIRKVSNRVIFLDNGHIIEDDTPENVFQNPKNERTKKFLAKMNMLKDAEYII